MGEKEELPFLTVLSAKSTCHMHPRHLHMHVRHKTALSQRSAYHTDLTHVIQRGGNAVISPLGGVL